MSASADHSVPPAGQVIVAAFYRFTAFASAADIRNRLAGELAAAGVRGTVLVAPEGINGTIAGSPGAIACAMTAIRSLPGCAGLDGKRSQADRNPFYRLKVRLKREIITMGEPGVDAAANTGNRVPPEGWNDLIADPDITVIDTRNSYETGIGTFKGAIVPDTASFGEFPDWFRKRFPDYRNRRFAMFCTGGIRCEKASAWLNDQGVAEVHQLDGGILKYLESTPAAQSAWQGECFVFDQRVSVGHGLQPGSHGLCHACRQPVSDEDRQHPLFVDGVSCHRCAGATGKDQKARYAERHRQVGLAKARGRTHLGDGSQTPRPRSNNGRGGKSGHEPQ